MDAIPKLPIVAAMEVLSGKSYRECMRDYMGVPIEDRIGLEREYLASIEAYNAAKEELEKPMYDPFASDPFQEMREQFGKRRFEFFGE